MKLLRPWSARPVGGVRDAVLVTLLAPTTGGVPPLAVVEQSPWATVVRVGRDTVRLSDEGASWERA